MAGPEQDHYTLPSQTIDISSESRLRIIPSVKEELERYLASVLVFLEREYTV